MGELAQGLSGRAVGLATISRHSFSCFRACRRPSIFGSGGGGGVANRTAKCLTRLMNVSTEQQGPVQYAAIEDRDAIRDVLDVGEQV